MKKSVWGFLLLVLLLAALTVVSYGATVENDYFYPSYSVSENGYIDLVEYVTDVSFTAYGHTYTQADLKTMSDNNTPLILTVGDTVALNFHFSLCGNAYYADDPTRLDPAASTHCIYQNGTTYLNGTKVEKGANGILDDSSLMVANTSRSNTFLRMDIRWLKNYCPGLTSVTCEGDNISFDSSNSDYLYIYFPNGSNGNTYAAPGYFSFHFKLDSTCDSMLVPCEINYYIPGSTGFYLPVMVVEKSEYANYGYITTYGDITVEKKWITDAATLPEATVLLDYLSNGVAGQASRVLNSGNSFRSTFTIRPNMTGCKLSEDMTGLADYVCELKTIDTTHYQFVNTLKKTYQILKTDESGNTLSGAQLVLYQVENGKRTQLDTWTSDAMKHPVKLLPGSYVLSEKKAPTGYSCTEVAFTVTDKYKIESSSADLEVSGTTLKIKDQPLTVSFAKQNTKGAALSGAKLQLRDVTANKIVDTWTTDGKVHTITKSVDGVMLDASHKYRLEELSAPKGYLIAEAVDFTFRADGSIAGAKEQTLVMVDRTTKEGDTGTDTNDPGGKNGGNNDGKNGGGGGENGGGGGDENGGKWHSRVQTGDSPMIWLELTLSILFLVAAGTLFVLSRRQAHSGKRGY